MSAYLTTTGLSVVALMMAAWYVTLGSAKTYDRCELARDLLHKHRLPANQISQWICLVRWESEFNTSAVGSLNADGSLDHGLFQISDKYWCYGPGPGEACGIPCEALQDDDIKDDVICAKRIFRQHKHLTGNGFNAWVAWRLHCQGDTDSYTADCELGPGEQEQKERKPQPIGQPAKPQNQQEQQQWPLLPPIPYYFPPWHQGQRVRADGESGRPGRQPPLAQLLPTGWLVFFK